LHAIIQFYISANQKKTENEKSLSFLLAQDFGLYKLFASEYIYIYFGTDQIWLK